MPHLETIVPRLVQKAGAATGHRPYSDPPTDSMRAAAGARYFDSTVSTYLRRLKMVAPQNGVGDLGLKSLSD